MRPLMLLSSTIHSARDIQLECLHQYIYHWGGNVREREWGQGSYSRSLPGSSGDRIFDKFLLLLLVRFGA